MIRFDTSAQAPGAEAPETPVSIASTIATYTAPTVASIAAPTADSVAAPIASTAFAPTAIPAAAPDVLLSCAIPDTSTRDFCTECHCDQVENYRCIGKYPICIRCEDEFPFCKGCNEFFCEDCIIRPTQNHEYCAECIASTKWKHPEYVHTHPYRSWDVEMKILNKGETFEPEDFDIDCIACCEMVKYYIPEPERLIQIEKNTEEKFAKRFKARQEKNLKKIFRKRLQASKKT